MHRRRYLVLASTVLVAGCQSDGDDVTPTTTGTDSETATATATETATETPTQTETETSTETETEKEEPSVERGLREAQRSLANAYDTYLSQGGDVDSLNDIGPATEGFDDDQIRSHLFDTQEHLEDVTEYANEEQQRQIEELRRAVRWLRVAAQMQAGMSSVVGEIRTAQTAIQERSEYSTIAARFEAAARSAEGVHTTKSNLERPGPRTFKQVQGLNRDMADEKHFALHRQAVAFDEFVDILRDTVAAVERLEVAETELSNDEPEDAEDTASNAENRLSDIRRRARDISADSFTPVARIFSESIEELQVIAEELGEKAEDA